MPAVATVIIYNEKICPIKSFKYMEKIMKLKLTANNIISIAINIIIIFLLFKTKPQIPIKNKNIEKVKYCIIFFIKKNVFK